MPDNHPEQGRLDRLFNSPYADFFTEVQKDNVKSHRIEHKFGRNPSVPNGSFAVVSTIGGTPAFLEAPDTVRIKIGGDADDDDGGVGAQMVTVQGLDSNFDEVTEDIVTNGVDVSASTTQSFWRIYRAFVTDGCAGTYGGSNAGDITIEDTSASMDLIKILADEGKTQHGMWASARNTTSYLMGVIVTADSGKAADIRFFIRSQFDDVTGPSYAPVRLQLYWDGILGAFGFSPQGPSVAIPEKSDVWFEAQSGAGGSEVSIDFGILIVDD